MIRSTPRKIRTSNARPKPECSSASKMARIATASGPTSGTNSSMPAISPSTSGLGRPSSAKPTLKKLVAAPAQAATREHRQNRSSKAVGILEEEKTQDRNQHQPGNVDYQPQQ